ncbi:cubilin-like isoform X2 [Haliotis asinina]
MPSHGSKRLIRFSISAVSNYTSVCDGSDAVHEVSVTQNPQYIIVPWSVSGLMLTMKKACRWHVHTDLLDHIVVMEMLVYDPPYGGLCSDNRINIYNGADNSSMQLVSACAMSDIFSRVLSREMFIESTILSTPNSQKSAYVMKIQATPECEAGVLTLAAATFRSYTVMEYNRASECIWHVKMKNSSMKMLDVGVKYPGVTSFNPSVVCPDNTTYLQVYTASAELSQYQVPKLCPLLNSQEYRIYGTALYLPTHPEVNMPRSVVPLYYYSSQGICDQNKPVDLQVTLEEQSLYSPNYPNTYWPHELCRWRLKSFSPYYFVTFMVSQFTSQSPVSFCTASQDHIAFFDGPSISSPRLAWRCAGLDTGWISSSTRWVYAEFKSYIGNTGKFNIKYKAVRRDSSCDKALQALSVPQNLSSSGFPTGPVWPSECWWRIIAGQEDNVVNVSVLQTNLFQEYYCTKSYVEAYDGKDSTEGLIIKWCSTSTPMFRSTGKYMFLKLHSGSDIDKGFLLTYTSTKAVITPCGTSLTAYNRVSFLSSPGYPDNYKNHLDCRWVVRAQSGFNTVKIEVTDAHLEYDCSFDNITIYDGSGMSARQLGVFCASNRPTLQSSGMFMFIRFQTDSSRTHKGFQIKYYETDDKTAENVCSKDLTSYPDPKYIQSPGYPNSYPSNLDCWWKITASDPSGQVQVTVFRSGIESSIRCTNDYVAVYEGDREGRELGRWCGQDTPTYVSVGRSMFLLFKTNMDNTDMGFQLQYFTTKACAAGHISELQVRLVPDSIESPNYPDNYPNDVSCSWRLQTNVSSYIRITVLNSDIESSENCGFDYIAAYDGATEAYPSLKKWCGYDTPTVLSSGPVLLLRFRTDGSGNRQGFRLEYVGVNTGHYDAPSSTTSLKAGTIAGVVCGCVVVTSILIIAMIVIIRRRQKNQQNADLSGRRSESRWQSRSYREQPWEVNQVFYSGESDYVTTPPPYSLVAGSHIPHDPPPPYPASEFTLPLKDEEEEQTPPCDAPDGRSTGREDISPCTHSSDQQRLSLRVQRDEEDSDKQDGGVQPCFRQSGGSGLGRATSVDNLVPRHRLLCAAPPVVLPEMTSQSRAVSVGDLLLGGATGQGFHYQTSQSETVLNRGLDSPGAREGQSRHPRSRHRLERLSPRHKQCDPTPNPAHGLHGASVANVPGASEQAGSNQRYTRRRQLTDKARDKRGNLRSEFESMRKWSRSHDNLTSDRLLASAARNPRWSVASEGYRNDIWFEPPSGRFGEARYDNPSLSNADIKTSRSRLAPRQGGSLAGARMDNAECMLASRDSRLAGDVSVEADRDLNPSFVSRNLSLEPEESQGTNQLCTTETSV